MSRELLLALGGGGVRGIAHIGVLQCLEDHDYKIDGIAGTSAGGLYGALYAAGVPLEVIRETSKSFMSNPNYKKESSDNYSLIGTAGLRELLEPLIGGMNIEDFPIPFRATASGMTSGEEVELSSGSAIEAVLATIAVPGVFPSRNYDDNVLVDGAVLNPIPVATARNIKSSLPIVAVVLHRTDVPMEPGDGYLKLYDGLPGEIAKGFTRTKIGETIRTFAKSMLMINDKLAELSLQVNEPDVIVDPKVGHFDMLQLVDSEELERLGYEAMQAKLTQLEEACSLLNTYRRISRYTSAKKD